MIVRFNFATNVVKPYFNCNLTLLMLILNLAFVEVQPCFC